MDKYQVDVARRIWNICKLSPEHGNAVMDLLGEDLYKRLWRFKLKILIQEI